MPGPTPTPTPSPVPTTTELAALLRQRWPHARIRTAGDTIRWVDGPARLDVYAHLARAGWPRAAAERAGIRLHRRLSRTTIAAVALHATESTRHLDDPFGRAPTRAAAIQLDELCRFEIPAGGPVPLTDTPGTDAGLRHTQARALAALQASRRPVDPDKPASWRPVLDRTLALAAVLEPAALTTGDTHVPAPGNGGPVNTDIDGPHPVTVAVALPSWPEHRFVAVTHPHRTPREQPRQVELHWTDGPSPTEVADHLAVHGWPPPLRPGLTHQPVRTLSDTATAAAVIVYHHRHQEPFRDEAARYHWMARWRSAAVREIDRHGRAARDRLRTIEDQLRDLPLPLAGPLPDPLAVTGHHDGAQLWRAAESLLAATPRPAPQRLTDPTIERALRPVRLAAAYAELGHDALDLLHTPTT